MADANQDNLEKDNIADVNPQQNPLGPDDELNNLFSGGEFFKPRGNILVLLLSRLSSLQKILIALIVVFASVLLISFLKFSGGVSPDAKQLASEKKPSSVADSNFQQLKPLTENKPDFEVPSSLKLAQTLFLEKKFEQAYNVYERLSRSLSSESKPLCDLLLMRMALCKKNVGDSDSALALIKSVLDSPSSLVRCLADYQYAIIEMQKGRFLNTRTRACQALALLSDVDLPDDLSMRLSRNCNFLADQGLLQHILAISTAGAESPRQLYNEIYDLDPLNGLNDTQLESLVTCGSDLLAKGLLGPKINRLQQSTDAVARWNVYCSGASVEELLAKFASSNSFELLWKFPGTDSAEDGARKRAVFLCMSNATAEQIVNVAAGSAGLIAFIDANNLITVTRPDEYSSLSAHINLLAKYSITLWQQFLLRFPKDSRTPDSHFALGLLKALCGEIPDALAEYKIVANRYPRTFLAPYALLNSAALKTGLKDYLGARQDLMQLTEQYPDVPIAEQAIFNLANAAMNASMFNQAILLYQKLYFLTSSEKFKADSAYSAAKCSYQLDNPQDTIHWAGEFIKLVNDKSDQRVSYAFYLLGKASFSLEKFADAYSAFNNALDADIPPEDYINILSTLVNAYIQKDSLLEAMAVVETAQKKQLPPIQNIQLMLLKCAVLRKMGFADKALASLNQMDEFIDQPQLKAQVLFESAQCLIALNRFEPARRNLTQFIVIAEKNPLFDQACLDLADVCLMLGQCDNAISTCKQLIDSKPLPSIKQEALVIMASAYKQKKNYDKAALALADNSRQESAAQK